MSCFEISIITVCRNAVPSIRCTIESVVAQKKNGQLEYIIIDGDSADGTQEIIKSFGSAVDIYVSEPDMGISDAFNKGILHSSGAIIGLINADDTLLPGTLGLVCDFFSSNPDVDVLHGDVILCDGDRIIKQMAPAGQWWYPWRLVLFNHPATFVRRRIYEKFGMFDTSFRIAMDVDIYLRWMESSVAMRYLPVPLVMMKTGGLSGKSAKQGFDEVRRIFIGYGYPCLVVNLLYLSKIVIHALLASLKRCKSFWLKAARIEANE